MHFWGFIPKPFFQSLNHHYYESSSRILIAILLFHCMLNYGFTIPQIQFKSHAHNPYLNSKFDMDRAIRFLQNFGYLPQSDVETQALRSMDEISDAIRVAQKFGAIRQTGLLDEATLNLIRKDRCGVPDIIDGGQNAYSAGTRDVIYGSGGANIATIEARGQSAHGRSRGSGVVRDRRRRYVLQGQKWDKNVLTYSITAYSEDIPQGTTRQIIHEAFKIWSDASALTFFEIAADNKNADILIEFARLFHGDPYPFDGPSRVLAHAFFPGPGRGGDIHFDEDELWTSEDRRGVILKEVAVHEIGHSLGLAHSHDPTSVMFPYYTNVGKDFNLPYDDAHGIHILYGSHHHHKSPPIVQVTVNNDKKSIHTTTKMATATRPTYVTTKARQVTPGVNKKEQPDPKNASRPEDPKRFLNSDGIIKAYWCGKDYQVIAMIRNEIFMFSGKWFWRIKDGLQQQSNPELISRFWAGFPKDLDSIDAVYERPVDGNIMFFKNRQIWLFHTNKLLAGYPKKLEHLGLPVELNKIDAALVWGYNKKTYFFASNMYWRFDEKISKVAPDYPRYIGIWRGIPDHVHSALVDKDGITYFFKGKHVYKFKDRYMSISRDYPKPIYTFFLTPHTMHYKDKCYDHHQNMKDGAFHSLNEENKNRESSLPYFAIKNSAAQTFRFRNTHFYLMIICIITSYHKLY